MRNKKIMQWRRNSEHTRIVNIHFFASVITVACSVSTLAGILGPEAGLGEGPSCRITLAPSVIVDHRLGSTCKNGVNVLTLEFLGFLL